MKRLIFIFVVLFNFAMTGKAQGLWIKMEVGGDKVEQKRGNIIYSYADDNVEICVDISNKVISLTHKNLFSYDFVTEERDSGKLEMTSITVATFDLNGKRTGYYKDVHCLLFNDHFGFWINKLFQIKAKEIYPHYIGDYLLNKSGSVIFRLTNNLGETLDFEVKTLKTLGYEDAINGKHVDGDVDVLGL